MIACELRASVNQNSDKYIGVYKSVGSGRHCRILPGRSILRFHLLQRIILPHLRLQEPFMKICWIALFCSMVAAAAPAQQAKLDGMVDQQLPSLVAIYKSIHASPELSHREEKTSALLAGELRSLGFEVTEHVGKFPNPDWKGYGVVALMKNGAGPTVLVRADMDALPVEEQTGLPYASHVRTKNDAGQDVGVMHACGHDIHVA